MGIFGENRKRAGRAGHGALKMGKMGCVPQKSRVKGFSEGKNF